MIENLITPVNIIFELEGNDRDEILAELTEILIKQNTILNRNDVFSSLVRREEKKSTLVSQYLAIPHAVSDKITEPIFALGLSRHGIEFNLETVVPEESLVKIVFCMLFPENKADLHLLCLKDVLDLVSEPGFIAKLLQAQDENEVCDLIKRNGV